MSKSLRLSEKWFRRGLWLVAFLFAWFLTGLGSTIVGDLPQVEQTRSLEDYMDPQRTPVLKESIKTAEKAAEAEKRIEQARASALKDVNVVAADVASDLVKRLIGVAPSSAEAEKAVVAARKD